MVAAVAPSCNDSQGDLLTPKLYLENDVINVSAESDTYECDIISRISTPVGNAVKVTYSAGGQDLVDKYNDRYGTTAEMFPAENYEFLNKESVVEAGQIYAEACKLQLKNMDQVQEGATFILPVTISTGDVDMIPDKNVAYVVIKKPVRILKAMQFGTYWLDVRLPVSFKTTTSVTYEALVLATCLLYTSPSPRDVAASRMPSSA